MLATLRRSVTSSIVSKTIGRTISRSLFIQTAETPNPHSLKFIPGRPVYITEDDSGYYAKSTDMNSITASPLAKRLIRSTDAVTGVYLGSDFVTVTKLPNMPWDRPIIFSEIMDHFASGEKAVEADIVSDTTIFDHDDEVVQMIKELLEVRIRPAVQEDGGDIKLVGYDEHTGVVSVRLEGSCVGCPSSSVTLKSGVENMLMHYIPEVTGVVSVEAEGDGSGEGGEFPEHNYDDIKVETTTTSEKSKAKSYEQKLADAGIPFSD